MTHRTYGAAFLLVVSFCGCSEPPKTMVVSSHAFFPEMVAVDLDGDNLPELMGTADRDAWSPTI